jgi:hypothetical protein
MFRADGGSDTDGTRRDLPPGHFSLALFLRGQGYRALLGAGTRGASSQPRALRRRPPVGMSKDYGRVCQGQRRSCYNSNRDITELHHARRVVLTE